MAKVVIRNLTEEPVELYDDLGILVGIIRTFADFLDVRVQIREQQVRGYYFKFRGEKIRIDHQGEIESYPDDMFDLIPNLLCKLI